MGELPEFVPPMLAKIGEPFDSDAHVFELKWDGIRALAFVGDGPLRLLSRRAHDMTARYPELAFLAELPPGCVLDGELVALDGGRSSFHRILRREQVRDARRIRRLVREIPVGYVVFDLLYRDFRPVLEEPLLRRRELLGELVAGAASPRLVFSDGVVGAGRAFFEEARRLEHEGVVAKRLNSAYAPGRRTDAWIKIKKASTLYCAVLGYVPKGPDDLRSLIVATDVDGVLTHVGRVGSGLTDELRARLMTLLAERRRKRPLVPVDDREGAWVEPGLFCTVSYVERTEDGMLRAPVFKELILE